MKEAKFLIGDYVKTKSPANIEGFVIDAMWSENTGWTYRVQENNQVFFVPEDDLEQVKEYGMEIKIDVANNVVIATLYESVGGGTETLAEGARSSDSRWCEGYCPGCKLCLHATVQEHGRC